MVERALICLLARGHCLIEGVPGLAKTLTVSTLARVMRRLLRPPPVHPRPGARPTSSAPASGGRRERSSTSSGGRSSPTSCWPTRSTGPRPRSSRPCSRSWPSARSPSGATPGRCPSPFLVLATQNPIESEGVYALPEAAAGPVHDADRRAPAVLRGGDRDRPAHGRAAAPSRRRSSPPSSWLALQADVDDVFVHHAVQRLRRPLWSWPPATRPAGGCPSWPDASPSGPVPGPRSASCRPAGPSPCSGAGGSSSPRTSTTWPPKSCATGCCSPTTPWPTASGSTRSSTNCSIPCRPPGWPPTRSRPPRCPSGPPGSGLVPAAPGPGRTPGSRGVGGLSGPRFVRAGRADPRRTVVDRAPGGRGIGGRRVGRRRVGVGGVGVNDPIRRPAGPPRGPRP